MIHDRLPATRRRSLIPAKTVNYQQDFVDFCVHNGIIQFGDFTLKSGRRSPYFFNTGLFDSGSKLAKLGEFYAQGIIASGQRFDMLFGPAYKGIPLACTTAIALAVRHALDVPYCSNRKEAKDHGEGGDLLGAPLAGEVLIIDDVITAGTSVNQSVATILKSGAKPAGVIIALDRQEHGTMGLTAVQEVEQLHGFKVSSIIGLDTLINELDRKPATQDYARDLLDYQRLGATTSTS